AFGIGTSEVEHVLATQTLLTTRSKNMRVSVDGTLPIGIRAKDIILAIIAKIGTAGGTGYVIEYAGDTIRSLSMEGRMTVCNMSIEAGARAGMIAPDETTFEYLKGRPRAPRDFVAATQRWRQFVTDPGARFDAKVRFDAWTIQPQVTWGTSPGMVTDVNSRVPNPKDMPNPTTAQAAGYALEYMGLVPGTPIQELRLDRVFIGSCTNSRI